MHPRQLLKQFCKFPAVYPLLPRLILDISNFWAYFEPVRINMPQNCSADVQAVIAHVDNVIIGENAAAIQTLKDSFGMGGVTHLDDFAGACKWSSRFIVPFGQDDSLTVRNNLWDWQSLQPGSPFGAFFKFCDALEVKNGVSAPITGWGLDHALTAWGDYFKTSYLPKRAHCPPRCENLS